MPFPPAVEALRPLVAKYFPPELVDKALYVIQHESGGKADAAGDAGVAIGLFQIQDNTRFEGRPSKEQLLDPEFNIRYAAEQLGAAHGNWAPWGEGVTYKGSKFGALGNFPYQESTTQRRTTMPAPEGLPEGTEVIAPNLARWTDPATGKYIYFRNNPAPFLDTVTGNIVPAGWQTTGGLPQMEETAANKLPQGAVSRASLEQAGATFPRPGQAKLPDGSTYEARPDGSYTLASEPKAAPSSQINASSILGRANEVDRSPSKYVTPAKWGQLQGKEYQTAAFGEPLTVTAPEAYGPGYKPGNYPGPGPGGSFEAFDIGVGVGDGQQGRVQVTGPQGNYSTINNPAGTPGVGGSAPMILATGAMRSPTGNPAMDTGAALAFQVAMEKLTKGGYSPGQAQRILNMPREGAVAPPGIFTSWGEQQQPRQTVGGRGSPEPQEPLEPLPDDDIPGYANGGSITAGGWEYDPESMSQGARDLMYGGQDYLMNGTLVRGTGAGPRTSAGNLGSRSPGAAALMGGGQPYRLNGEMIDPRGGGGNAPANAPAAAAAPFHISPPSFAGSGGLQGDESEGARALAMGGQPYLLNGQWVYPRLPGFATGGQMITREPIVGMGVRSGRPQFVVGEGGRPERLDVTPLQRPAISSPAGGGRVPGPPPTNTSLPAGGPVYADNLAQVDPYNYGKVQGEQGLSYAALLRGMLDTARDSDDPSTREWLINQGFDPFATSLDYAGGGQGIIGGGRGPSAGGGGGGISAGGAPSQLTAPFLTESPLGPFGMTPPAFGQLMEQLFPLNRRAGRARTPVGMGA